MNNIVWFLLMPSGLYTNGYTSSTVPPSYLETRFQIQGTALTPEECFELAMKVHGQCLSMKYNTRY